jgi:plasmid stabilization system protein ParE
MRQVVYRQKALADIDAALDYSEAEWGLAQRHRYEDIIAEAAEALARNPFVGRPRPELDPEARSLFIKRPGKNASHILYYFVGADENVYVIRLLHTAQDPGLNVGEEAWKE